MTVGGHQAVGSSHFRGWLAAAVLVLLPALKYGFALQTGYMVPALATLVVSYVAAIYLYEATARLGLESRIGLLIGAGVAALVIGIAVCPHDYKTMMLSEMILIPATGLVVGWRLRAGDRALRVYIFGTIIVVIGGIAMFAPYWGISMTAFQSIGLESVDGSSSSLTAFGYQPDAVTAYTSQMERVVRAVTRLIPAATVMNVVTQFSVGFIWLLWRGVSSAQSTASLAPFARWKVPFALTPVLIVAALGRLIGGDMIALVADNVLLGLSIFYCVGGLALIEHALRRFKLPMGVRILFYIVLIITGLVGYVATVLLGFIDSFADWRRVSHQSIELNKS